MGVLGSTLPSALLITGTVGAGKTSVAEAVGDLLSEAGVPNAVIDLDWLRRSWPSPAGDRFNLAMELRNLRAVARNYLDAGAVRIVIAGVIETQVDRDSCQDVLGVPLSVCRLRVDLPVVRARLARRHEGRTRHCSGTWPGPRSWTRSWKPPESRTSRWAPAI